MYCLISQIINFDLLKNFYTCILTLESLKKIKYFFKIKNFEIVDCIYNI